MTKARSTSCALAVTALAVVGLSACSQPTAGNSTHVTATSNKSVSAAATASSVAPSANPGDALTTATVAPRPVVGEVPGRPAAAPALGNWADDLITGDLAVLESKCWTIAPQRVRSTYADKDAILAAIANPGIEGQWAYIWEDDTTRVSVKRSEIASGYACPHVSPKSDVHIFNATDARYVVLRYLQRVIGAPVNRDDTETNYPLECHEYDPLSDTSRSIAASVVSFDRDSLAVSGGPDEWQVVVSGQSASGNREFRFSTNVGPEGYCISEVN